MTSAGDEHTFTVTADGMCIDYQVPVTMSDGAVLRADVFRPCEDARYPVILSHGVYAKGLPSTGRSTRCSGTSSWPRIPVSSRAPPASIRPGRSPTRSAGSPTDMWSSVSTHEGRAGRPASSGPAIPRSTTTSPSPWSGRRRRTMEQRQGRAHGHLLLRGHGLGRRRPPARAPGRLHRLGRIQRPLLATPTTTVGSSASSAGAGRSDRSTRSNMAGDHTPRVNPNTGQSVAGPVDLSDEELEQNRVESFPEVKAHPFFDDWHLARGIDLGRVTVPFLTAANWGGQGIHPRGNFNGFLEASSQQKWLEAHGDTHWTHFYSALRARPSEALLRPPAQGSGQWLRSHPTCPAQHPSPRREVRVARRERMAPGPHQMDLAQPTRGSRRCPPSRSSSMGPFQYDALGEGLHFATAPFPEETEITGPSPPSCSSRRRRRTPICS